MSTDHYTVPHAVSHYAPVSSASADSTYDPIALKGDLMPDNPLDWLLAHQNPNNLKMNFTFISILFIYFIEFSLQISVINSDRAALNDVMKGYSNLLNKN